MARFLSAVLIIAVAISVNGGSAYKKSGEPPVPPTQIDDDVDTISSRDEIVVGDMILTKDRIQKVARHARVKRRPYDNDYKWPKSGSTVTIPYTQSGVDSKVLQRAIEVFNAKTCIRFVPRGSQANYVAFQSSSQCNAQVGYRGSGEQTCTLSSNCAAKKGKVLHEMMHILGFLHEQCRSDRDSYVTIQTANIKPGTAPQFEIQSDVDQGISYDCDSILHYKATAFSTSSSATISSPNGYCTSFGNGDTRLSLKDYKRVNTFYNCDPNSDYRYITVKVVTDGSFLSGTDCFIYMKLHGTVRTSTEFELDLDVAGSSNLFERSSEHTFKYMAYRDDLGPITGISIRMVSNGSGEGWWPDSFTIYDPVNEDVKFGNTAWLNPSSTYGPSYFPKQ